MIVLVGSLGILCFFFFGWDGMDLDWLGFLVIELVEVGLLGWGGMGGGGFIFWGVSDGVWDVEDVFWVFWRDFILWVVEIIFKVF